MKELSLPEHQHVCTLNTSGYIAHTIQVLGESAISQLFDELLDNDGRVKGRTHLGRPVDVRFFQNPDNWFDNELNLQLFANADALGLDLVETGKVTATSSLTSKNGVVIGLGLVQILGAGQILKEANRVNALFNRTNEAYISSLSDSGALLTINYRPAFTHSELVTLHNIGTYIAILEYLGYRDVDARIVSDRFATEGRNGLTEIQFSWQPKTLAERMQFFLASFASKKLLSPYLRSSCYLHDFHPELINDYHYQLARKNQVLKQLEVKYLSEVEKKNAINEEQDSIIDKPDKKMSKRDQALKEQLEQWVSTCELELLQSVTEAAKALHLTDKTFNRKVRLFYLTNPKHYMREQLIKRSIPQLAENTVETVAMRCGYANTSSYTRAFKAVMGYPPTDVVMENTGNYEPDVSR